MKSFFRNIINNLRSRLKEPVPEDPHPIACALREGRITKEEFYNTISGDLARWTDSKISSYHPDRHKTFKETLWQELEQEFPEEYNQLMKLAKKAP